MNKFILRMMAIMIALTMSVGFVSCNDDDDNGSNGAGFPPALTGTVDKESRSATEVIQPTSAALFGRWCA